MLFVFIISQYSVGFPPMYAFCMVFYVRAVYNRKYEVLQHEQCGNWAEIERSGSLSLLCLVSSPYCYMKYCSMKSVVIGQR